MPLPARVRRLAAAGALTVLVTGFGLTSAPGATASTADQVRELEQRQREVRAQQAQAAAQLDLAQADDAQAKQALAAVTAALADQVTAVQVADQRAEDADTAAAQAQAAADAAQARVAGARQQVSSQALAAYVNPERGDLLGAFFAGSASDAVVRTGLSRLQSNQLADALDVLGAASDDAQQASARAQRAAQRAQQRRQEAGDALAQLQSAKQRQGDVTQAVELRLERADAEAGALRRVDATVAAQLEQQQTALAQEVAQAKAEAARQAQAQAQAEAARQAQLAAAQRAATQRAASGASGSAAPPSPASSSSSGSSGGSPVGAGSSAASGGSAGSSRPAARPAAIPPAGPRSGAIVRAAGIEVDSSIAARVEALVGAAGQAGFSLGGGGYRDPAEQIAVRRNNCGTSDYAIYEMPPSDCNPPAARPGSSMHELGLAIDFLCNGALVSSRGSSCYGWLAANAGSYGLYNLPSEPWHWSTNGN